ncbi:t111 [Tupaiid betaherpesvirus 1]|uniref:T111 n=1 Tax=Tupaiid herpesvirus 1 (strain 1) TaxID=10397 RepID=Q91TJ2_TUHV1|nr:t111 [Tupaiid betaherpesvirus 1]AAK57155.1 t111 [Tupaiid betaherpesvirus 1]
MFLSLARFFETTVYHFHDYSKLSRSRKRLVRFLFQNHEGVCIRFFSFSFCFTVLHRKVAPFAGFANRGSRVMVLVLFLGGAPPRRRAGRRPGARTRTVGDAGAGRERDL